MRIIPAIIAFVFAVVVLWACSKDKFETKPRIEIKDYNTRDVVQGSVFRVRINYFDKEGDLDRGVFTAIINRQNKFPLPPSQDKVDTLHSFLPEFPPKDNGEISYQLGFDFLKESLTHDDTIVFKFAVMDRAGNQSDTITSEQIVIHLP